MADHLDDATEALVQAGLDREDAERRAIDDFGDLARVVPDFQTTLAVAAPRRTAGWLLVALVAQPFLWDQGLHLAATTHVQAPETWFYAALDRAIEVCGAIVMVGALLAMLTSGIGSRWVAYGRPAARATGAFALAAALTLPSLCISMTAISEAPTEFWVLVSLLMVAPLAGVAVSARRTLALT